MRVPENPPPNAADSGGVLVLGERRAARSSPAVSSARNTIETFFEAGATPRPDDLTAVMLVDDEFDAEECCRAMQAYCCEVVLVPKPLAQHRLRPGQAIRLRRQQPGPSPLRRCQLAQAAPGGTGDIPRRRWRLPV